MCRGQLPVCSTFFRVATIYVLRWSLASLVLLVLSYAPDLSVPLRFIVSRLCGLFLTCLAMCPSAAASRFLVVLCRCLVCSSLLVILICLVGIVVCAWFVRVMAFYRVTSLRVIMTCLASCSGAAASGLSIYQLLK